MLFALILLVCVSIFGREVGSLFPGLGIGSVLGDFEIVEAGMAFAIFCFLPLVSIEQGHAVVDILSSQLPRGAQRVLMWVADVTLAVVMVIIAVQLFAGTLSKMNSGQTTLLVQFPIWWAYAASLLGAVPAALVAIYMAVMRSAELVTGRDILPISEGAEA